MSKIELTPEQFIEKIKYFRKQTGEFHTFLETHYDSLFPSFNNETLETSASDLFTALDVALHEIINHHTSFKSQYL